MRTYPTTTQELIEHFDPPLEGVLVQYSRFTGDYICFVNGELLGYADTYADGRKRCDASMYDQLVHDAYLTAVATAVDTADMAADHAAEEAGR